MHLVSTAVLKHCQIPTIPEVEVFILSCFTKKHSTPVVPCPSLQYFMLKFMPAGLGSISFFNYNYNFLTFLES